MRKLFLIATILFVAFQFTFFAHAGDKKSKNQKALDPVGIKQLKEESPAKTKVYVSDATGAVRFIGFGAGGAKALDKAASAQDRSLSFLQKHGSVFGLKNAMTELKIIDERSDFQGGKHLSYAQQYFGVPVFAGVLKTHFDAAGQLRAINGTVIPEINVNHNPTRKSDDAAASALARIIDQKGKDESISVAGTRLMVFRSGLLRGVPGQNHLVWEVEVSNGADVREFVYIDAHTGKFVDQITGIVDSMFRRAYDALGQTAPGPNYPASPYWVEGNPFPTASTEANNMILASGEAYGFFSTAFGRDSFDGVGGIMDSIFNRGNACPNASWNGTFISFCPGTTSDDVTVHEWGHAYTQYTHDLIYQWQSGALNESYSDIWGETVDIMNGRQTDTPSTIRLANSCSTSTTLPPSVTVNAPPAIAGQKQAGSAAFGPQSFNLTNDIVLANDGVAAPSTSDGCCAGPSFDCAPNSWANAAAVAGKIALVDRGTCGFEIKARNAQANGAVGVIVANNTAGIINMAGDALPDPTIPSLSILQTDGNAIKGQLAIPTTVNATMARGATGTDNSLRWLMGEDATAFGQALRDMWNPTCYGNPGKVTDTQYFCGTGDNGGVHLNSGVPNHAYALIVDGGTYNGQTITALGFTKAAHIYFRAMAVYQGPASNFADHEVSILQSAEDLVGMNLPDLATGLPSGQIISTADVTEVEQAMQAVEMSTSPTQCNFQPILAKNPPALCAPGDKLKVRFKDTFEDVVLSNSLWSVSHEAVTPADFTDRDWVIVTELPDNRAGKGFFGVNPNIGTCGPGGDESGVLHLTSPQITIPSSASAPRISFDHWIATEIGWDGGNVKVSVNNGPWQTVQSAAFIYNPYNLVLNPAPGNTNPLAGQPAFSGTDQGSVSGSWGRSIINLTGYAGPNDKIRVRLDIGNDGCTGIFGWYIDDFQVYTCK